MLVARTVVPGDAGEVTRLAGDDGAVARPPAAARAYAQPRRAAAAACLGGAAGGLAPVVAASNRLITSAVRSSPGSAQTIPASARLRRICSAFSCDDLLDDRGELALEFQLQLLLQLLQLGVGVLLHALDLDVQPVDFLAWPRRALPRSARSG